MRRHIRPNLLPVALASLAFALLPGSSSASQSWHEPADLGGADPGCVAAAEAQRPEAWVCDGGILTTTTTNSTGGVDVTTQVIDDTYIDTTGELAPQFGDMTDTDDYDYWCENVPKCGRLINPYVAEVKGNAAYGNAGGFIGSFDHVVRQSFNGGYPRWRSLLIWDYGPGVTTLDYDIKCRRHKPDAPDPVCGHVQMYHSKISSAKWRSWYPGEKTYLQSPTKLSGGYKYHDDAFGIFTADGYSTTTWGLGVIHTGRWTWCPACKYYQVPWTTTP